VRVHRPGVTVRTRTGYYPASTESRPAPSTAPAAAIAGLLPRSDVPLSLGLAPELLSDGGTAMDVRLGVGLPADVARHAAPTRADGLAWVPPQPGDRFHVIVGVFDDRGKPVSSLHADVTAPPAAAGGVGCEWRRSLEMKPGRYEVRVGVVDAASRQAGSVYGYVDVPDPASRAFSLADVSVQTTPASAGGRPNGDAAATPTLRRAFAPSEHVTAHLTLYRVRPRASLLVRMRVLDVRGRVVADSTRTIPPGGEASAPLVGVRAHVAMEDLVPGRYLLSITASTTDGRDEQRRDIPFRVR
jgi:hypothetical protein